MESSSIYHANAHLGAILYETTVSCCLAWIPEQHEVALSLQLRHASHTNCISQAHLMDAGWQGQIHHGLCLPAHSSAGFCHLPDIL